ncbi:MAG TPA: SHOCT domain-containing protein [Streptosporangiaceae bacterium]|nr:SHOCT domain-containing protein [Streptosporangiaceae bacterium]
MMHMYGDHVSGWGYALGITGMILFWGLLAVAIAAAARYLGRDHRGRGAAALPMPPPTPEQALADRFARGEIDADEYHQRLDTLRQAARPSPTGTPS